MNHPVEKGASVRELLAQGELVAAARREADFAERDGYDVTADLLRQLADEVERPRRTGRLIFGDADA